MFCPSCGATVQSGQKFCTSCGSALAGAATTAPAAAQVASAQTDGTPTPPLGQALPPPPAATAPATTVLPAMSAATPAAAAVTTGQYPAANYEGPAWDAAGGTWEPTGMTAVVGGVQPFRMTPLVATASLAAVLAVAAAFVNVIGVKLDDTTGLPVTDLQLKLNDFSSNLTVGAILAGLLLIVGASMGATGRRVGTGLAGGAGLALAGMMAMVLGQATQTFDTYDLLLRTNGGVMTATRDIGFWLAVVSALLGGAAFVLSFEGAGHDGHPPIHPAIGALGLLGTAMAVIGPLIPLHNAPFGDQFSNDFTPPATLLLRQLVLILIAVGGVVGFTRKRRWGLGLALGAISVGAWQMITAATESGDIATCGARRTCPLSYAGGNPGALDFTPHTVTIIGVIAMIVAGVGGLILAAQRPSSS